MELKHCYFSVVFFIFLLISASSVTGRKVKDESETEVYEIDYRGPETHSSSFPPPDNSNGSPQNHRSNNTNQLPTQLYNLKPEDSNSATKHKASKTMHV